MPRRLEPLQATVATSEDTMILPVVVTNKKTGDTKELEFEVYGAAPARATKLMTEQFGAFLDFQEVDKRQRAGQQIEVTKEEFGVLSAEFMDVALLPESAQRWRDLLDDNEWGITSGDVQAAQNRIIEGWAGRPTERSNNSSAVGSQTPVTSTGIAFTTPG